MDKQTNKAIIYSLEEVTLALNLSAAVMEKLVEANNNMQANIDAIYNRLLILEAQQAQQEHDQWAENRTVQ